VYTLTLKVISTRLDDKLVVVSMYFVEFSSSVGEMLTESLSYSVSIFYTPAPQLFGSTRDIGYRKMLIRI